MRARYLLALLVAGFLLQGCGTRTVYVQMAPPAVRGEVPPPKPGRAYVWVPGHWDWHGGRHVWVAGHWVREKPGCQWAPGYWKQTQQGWAWNEGRWEKHSPKKSGHHGDADQNDGKTKGKGKEKGKDKGKDKGQDNGSHKNNG